MIDVVAEGIRVHVDDVWSGYAAAEIPVQRMVPMRLISDTERREEPAVFGMMCNVIDFRQSMSFRPGVLIASAKIKRQFVSPFPAILSVCRV